MNCWWIWSIMALGKGASASRSAGEKGSSMPLFSPAVSRRRSTPSLSIRPVKPKPSISTPIAAHDAGLVDVDLVGGHGDVVGAEAHISSTTA
jgi:hypothetical protein